MNRISPLLQKLSELYLSKVRTQHLQEGMLQDGDIDVVMRQTRAAYSELLEWQRTMSEIEALLLQEGGTSDTDFSQSLPAPPPPARAAARPVPPPPPPPAPKPAPAPKAAEPAPARATFTPIAAPAAVAEPEPEPEPQHYGDDDDSFFATAGADEQDVDLEEEEEVAPPPPPRAAPRPAPVEAAPAPVAMPRPKAATAPGSVSDIRELVSVNDKYLFVSELFNHNRTAYEKAMEAINKFRSRIQATNWVNALVKKEYKWDDDSATAKAFYKVINQYFAAK